MAFWESRPDAYYRSVYVQPVQALATLGPADLVDCALRLYVARTAYRIARPRDLVEALSAVFPDARAKLARFRDHGMMRARVLGYRTQVRFPLRSDGNTGAPMGLLADLKAAMAVIEAAVAELEPECLAAGDAVALVEVFARGERVCTAGRALAGRRVARASAWRASGERSAAHWMARQAGTSVGEAVNVLRTAERVESLPAVNQAFRSGDLSGAQATEISSAALASPNPSWSCCERRQARDQRG